MLKIVIKLPAGSRKNKDSFLKSAAAALKEGKAITKKELIDLLEEYQMAPYSVQERPDTNDMKKSIGEVKLVASKIIKA